MFTLKDMERFATEAWGPLGTRVVAKWDEFNRLYFDGRLRPVPLVITNTQPFGKVLAFCSYSPDGRHGRTITLNVPRKHSILLADNTSLLHEMIHQLLFESGDDARHESEGWRREIMRLNKLITGREIWAGRSQAIRRKEAGKSRVVRANLPHPETGQKSLDQMAIATWPRSCGIRLGRLGM